MADEIFLNIVKEKDQLQAKRFESFLSKYSNCTDEDTDEIDLETMTIVKDRGHVQRLKTTFGNSNVTDCTIIKKYVAHLEEKKRKNSLSMSSTRYTPPKRRSKRLSWCEDESEENSDPEESSLLKNVLQSFQSCAENMLHDFLDVRRQNPKIARARRVEMSFGKGNYSLKNSLLYGNKLWDITLQVSVRDITCSQKDFNTCSPLESISKDVSSTDKSKSVLVNLLNLMRIKSSHISRSPVMPLKTKNRSTAPMCDILVLKDKDDADCTKEELCSAQKFQSKNLRAIKYSPVSSTSTLLSTSTTSRKQDTCYSKEKLCPIQKMRSKSPTTIKCSSEVSTPIHCGAINSSGRNDDGHAKELCSIQKLESGYPKALMYPIIRLIPIHLDASLQSKKLSFIDDGESSIQKTKIVCNKKESNVLESNANIPGKQLDTGAEDLCSTKKMNSLEKTLVRNLLNKESMKYSPVTFKPTHLNPSTSSRKRCSIDDNEKSIQKTITTPKKKENIVPESGAIITGRKSETRTKVTCSTVESSNVGQTPVCNLISKKDVKYFPTSSTPVCFDASTPSRKYHFVDDGESSIQKTKKICNKKESNVVESHANILGKQLDPGTADTSSTKKISSLEKTPVCDLINKESLKYSPETFRPTRLNPSIPPRKRYFIDDDEKSIQKTIKTPQTKENNVPESSAVIIGRESETRTKVTCSTVEASNVGQTPVCDLLNKKYVEHLPTSLTPVCLAASTPSRKYHFIDDGEPSIQKTKKSCYKKESNVLKSNAIPGKQLDPRTENACSTEEISSLEKTPICELLNEKSMKLSPMTFRPTRLNLSTPSRKYHFIDDGEPSIQKTKKICNKKESNLLESNASPGKQLDPGTENTCSMEEISSLEKTPICDLLNEESKKFSPMTFRPTRLNLSTPSRKRCFIDDDDDDEKSIQKTIKAPKKKENKVPESSANITGTESNSVTEVTCSTDENSSCAKTPVCDLLLCLNKRQSSSTPIKTSARSSLKRKCTVNQLEKTGHLDVSRYAML